MIKLRFCLPLFLLFSSLRADESLMQEKIEHVVILMLENRSFDNVLGLLYHRSTPHHFLPLGTDPHYWGLSEETPNQYTNVLRNSKGEVVFSSPPIIGLPSLDNCQLINSPKFDPHEPFDNVTLQIFNGGTEPTMSGFLQDYASLWKEEEWLEQKKDICAVMEMYTQQELPIFHCLAKHYAVSDYYFSSVPTQTNPNRAFSICGTSDGQINNGFLSKNLFTSDTLWNRLSEESPDTSWTIFWQSDFVPVLYPGPLSGTNLFASLQRIPNLDSHFKRFDEFHNLARKGELPVISYLEPQWTLSVNISPKEKEVLSAILRDQEFIVGCQGNDAHPPGDVRTAENLVANVYTSLIANPEAWNKTLFIIVFDEHGGLFDHLSPPAAIPPDDQHQNGFNFDRYGVRVPALFISPLIAEGTVFRPDNLQVPFDHTSIISTMLSWRKIDRSKWNLGQRVAHAPTFDSIITLKEARLDAILSQQEENDNTEEDAFAGNLLYMGDKFFIKDAQGNYLIKPFFFYEEFARLGIKEARLPFTLAGGVGVATIGSFALLQCCDSSLGKENLLQTSLTTEECSFEENRHNPNQWWTLKSADSSSIGAALHYGERIYLENHSYFDLIQYVPCRLSPSDSFSFVKTLPIIAEKANSSYWILEKCKTSKTN